MQTDQQSNPSAKTIHLVLGAARVAVLLGLALVAACGGGQSSATPASFPTATPTAGPTTTSVQSPSPSPHEGDEGLVLGQETGESVYQGGRCQTDAPVRAFEVAAISIEISLNRFLDYDPIGRMYVLEQDLGRARLEEAQNRAARLDQAEPAVSVGLQGDAIQPLTLRVNQGDCLRVTLRNALEDGEAASLHLHGSSLHMAGSGAPAVAANLEAAPRPAPPSSSRRTSQTCSALSAIASAHHNHR